MSISLNGRVALVTGAGGGLGRAHALALAEHGARVVVNDLDDASATAVAREITDRGGEAVPFAANVTDVAAVSLMVAAANANFGSVDILINNAGILKDRTFANMDLADFRLVVDVHLMGSVICTKAVWAQMRERKYGRVVFTTSSSGLYGNFGQSNYGAAKMALVGLMQTLGLEGGRYGIRVNCLAPSAATQMTESLYDQEMLAGIEAGLVSPAVVMLASDHAPTRRILLAGAGCFEQANITMTRGLNLTRGGDVAADLAAGLDAIADREGEMVPSDGRHQYRYEVAQATGRALVAA